MRTARHAARLAAVQALYQMELTSGDAEEVAQEFVEHRFGGRYWTRERARRGILQRDPRGVPHHQVEIDRSVARCLSADWKLERIDSILRAILRAATYEFIAAKMCRQSRDRRICRDRHAFFSGDEPAFVNAVLDKLAHRKRAPEFGETPPDDELQFSATLEP